MCEMCQFEMATLHDFNSDLLKKAEIETGATVVARAGRTVMSKQKVLRSVKIL